MTKIFFCSVFLFCAHKHVSFCIFACIIHWLTFILSDFSNV